MRKGFTLIELLAVIILLGILSLIVVTTVNGTLKDNKEKTCLIQKQNIIDGAKNWANKNVFSLPKNEGEKYRITINELQVQGFLDKNIKNPKTDEILSPDMEIIITRIDNNYNYELEMEC